MELTSQEQKELSTNLAWLVANWKSKRLSEQSEYNQRFCSALLAIVDNKATSGDVNFIVQGTVGKIADDYASLLDDDPSELAKDPWRIWRRLGSISEILAKKYEV